MAVRGFSDIADRAFQHIRRKLGAEVEWLPKSGGHFTFTGIFDSRGILIDPDTERRVSTNNFLLGYREQDLPAVPVKGDKAKVNGVEYKVVDILEDEVEGVSGVMVLHKVTC